MWHATAAALSDARSLMIRCLRSLKQARLRRAANSWIAMTSAVAEARAQAFGPSTVVGSAAFNLFVISAICIIAIPSGEGRKIKAVRTQPATADCTRLRRATRLGVPSRGPACPPRPSERAASHTASQSAVPLRRGRMALARLAGRGPLRHVHAG